MSDDSSDDESMQERLGENQMNETELSYFRNAKQFDISAERA